MRGVVEKFDTPAIENKNLKTCGLGSVAPLRLPTHRGRGPRLRHRGGYASPRRCGVVEKFDTPVLAKNKTP